jgi:hypothetical protein
MGSVLSRYYANVYDSNVAPEEELVAVCVEQQVEELSQIVLLTAAAAPKHCHQAVATAICNNTQSNQYDKLTLRIKAQRPPKSLHILYSAGILSSHTARFET